MTVLIPLANAATPTTIGLKFSDGRAFTQMAGKTADGCSNWVDSFTTVNNGFHDAGYPGLAYGTTTLGGGIITAQWYSATTFSGGAADTAEQQLYFSYLDDGDGNPVNNDGIGVSVTLSGLGNWLAANGATHYQLRLYQASTWNLDQMTATTPVSVRLGAPNASNSASQLTALAVLETVQVPWLGDGAYPAANNGNGATRGYSDSSTNLSSDTITITIPSLVALNYSTRGTLAAIKLTAVDPVIAPPPPAAPQLPLGNYAQTVTNNAPVAYWRLNETNGFVAADAVGSNDGTIDASVTPGVSGPQNPPFAGFETSNTGMQLNYVTDSFLTMPALNMNTNTVTITGWINPRRYQADWAGVVFCRSGSTVAGLNFGPGTIANELRYTWANSRWDVGTGLVVPTNQWSFFALVVKPDSATIYLGTNGLLVSFTDTVSQTNQAFDVPLLVGYDSAQGSRMLDGRIDEVAIYNRSLTFAQIQQLYTSAWIAPPALTAFQTWQVQYFGSTNCPQAAGSADSCGKGMCNAVQFLAGLDPTNSTSQLAITSLVRQGNDINVIWKTAGIRTNIVQVSAGCTTNFADIPGSLTIIPVAGDATTNYVEAGGATNSPSRFYRVRLVP
jgi:concanavalin A-like lectin/glucanase superfamily protein